MIGELQRLFRDGFRQFFVEGLPLPVGGNLFDDRIGIFPGNIEG